MSQPKFLIHGETRKILQKRKSELRSLVLYWWHDYPISEATEEEKERYFKKKEELRCLEQVINEPYPNGLKT